MKNKLKKILKIVLFCVIVFSSTFYFVSCGKKKPQDIEEDKSPKEESQLIDPSRGIG